MIAAVCCPGPSLRRTWRSYRGPDHADGRSDRFGLIIAVNRALNDVAAHVLCAGDVPIFQGAIGDRRPSRSVFTMPDTIGHLRGDPAWRGTVWESWDACAGVDEHRRAGHLEWSVQYALLYAAAHGASAVHLYGCDQAGDTYADGSLAPGDLHPERWVRERRDLAITITLLHARGVTVNRITDTP